MNLKDSGERRHFETGAVRDIQKGKGRMDLLPPRALIELSKLFEAGCEKYGDRNWEKGIQLHSFIDSGLRHIERMMAGDISEPHLTQACWNLLCCIETYLRIEEGLLPPTLNDLPCPISLFSGPQNPGVTDARN
jgi:hypothetical protein